MNADQEIEFTVTEDATPSEEVLTAVATAERTDPTRLEPSLYAVVDPDALDALVRSWNGSGGRVEFVYRGHVITVQGDETVTLRLNAAER